MSSLQSPLGVQASNANDMKLTPSAIDEISGALDNLADTTVQKTETVDKLVAMLHMVTNEILRLNKIIEVLTMDPKKADKSQKDWDLKGHHWSYGYKVECNHTSKTCKNNCEGHKDNAAWNNTIRGLNGQTSKGGYLVMQCLSYLTPFT